MGHYGNNFIQKYLIWKEYKEMQYAHNVGAMG
jgi:hypothetical protein